MLNVVILGAGVMGQNLAESLSSRNHNVVLIDNNRKVLEEISMRLDVAVKYGSGADWRILDELLDISPDFFIGLTPQDEVNLVATTVAKNLGYKKTIARVRGNRFLNRSRLDFQRLFATDELFCPELLAAHEIEKFILSSGSLKTEFFAHGAVELSQFRVSDRWRNGAVPIRLLNLPTGLIIGLLAKETKEGEKTVIFPHGNDTISGGDEITCMGERDVIDEARTFFGAPKKEIRSVVLVGGSLTAVHLTRLLNAQKVAVRIVEKDYEKCCQLSELLPHSTLINHDGADIDFLLSEKVDLADLFVTCTGNEEVNFLTALQAKKSGVQQVVSLLSRKNDQLLGRDLGISLSVSPTLSATNQLLSWILSSKGSFSIPLYDNQAEVVELKISSQSRVIGIPIKELGPLLPQDLLIGVIQNRGRVLMANGNQILSPGDSLIVFTHPRHLKELEKVF